MSETRIQYIFCLVLVLSLSLNFRMLSLLAQLARWESPSNVSVPDKFPAKASIIKHQTSEQMLKWFQLPVFRPSLLTPRGGKMSCPHQGLFKQQICKQDQCHCLKPVNLGVHNTWTGWVTCEIYITIGHKNTVVTCVARLVGVLSHRPKGCGFDSWSSGHISRLQVPSPVGVCTLVEACIKRQPVNVLHSRLSVSVSLSSPPL